MEENISGIACAVSPTKSHGFFIEALHIGCPTSGKSVISRHPIDPTNHTILYVLIAKVPTLEDLRSLKTFSTSGTRVGAFKIKLSDIKLRTYKITFSN